MPPTNITIVPAASTTNTTWDMQCQHYVEQLAARIPLSHMQAMNSPPEATPLFEPKNLRTTRECFRGTPCFRAVRDNFVSHDEAAAIWTGIEPHYERGMDRNGEKFISIRPEYVQPAGLLGRVTARMAKFLEDEMGARNVRVAHTNSRGEWRLTSNLTAGRAAAARRQQRLLAGTYSERKGHIDSARPTNWHYTCLLYVGEHGDDEFAGGETLLVDEVYPSDGAIRRALLVEPRRRRLLAFTSGIENVHTALTATHGYRSLIQVWFKCDDKVSIKAAVGRRRPPPSPSEEEEAHVEL